jgi:hypothetical protein
MNLVMQTVTPIGKVPHIPCTTSPYFKQSVLASSSIWGLSEHYQADDTGICALSVDRLLCAFGQTITFRIWITAAVYTLLREAAKGMIASVIVGPYNCGSNGSSCSNFE